MATGNRGKGGGKWSDETRVGSLDEDERERARRARSNETRMARVAEDEEPETLPPPSAGESNRTMFASQAALFADRLRERFAQKRYGRAPNQRLLRIDEPEGPSTAGGRLARQSLSLITRSGTAPTLVCGWVDVAREEAQLRGYESVAMRYEAHHGTPLNLAARDYERCLENLEAALSSGGIRVRVIIPEDPVAPRDDSPSPSVTAPRGPPLGWGLAAVAVAFLLGVLVGRWSG